MREVHPRTRKIWKSGEGSQPIAYVAEFRIKEPVALSPNLLRQIAAL
jgi:hypothetical protein